MSLGKAVQCAKRPFHTPHAWASCPSHCQARSETDCHGRLGRRSIFRTLCLSQPPRQFHASIGKGSACLPVPAQCRLPVAKPTKSLTEKTVCLVTYWQERSLICLSLYNIYMCVCVRAPRSKVRNWLKWWKSPIPFFLQTTSNNSSMRMALPYTQLHNMTPLISSVQIQSDRRMHIGGYSKTHNPRFNYSH